MMVNAICIGSLLCVQVQPPPDHAATGHAVLRYQPVAIRRLPAATELSKAAMQIMNRQVVYDAAYCRIPYPMGDVPAGRGVCTDVVIRAYRLLRIDLQQVVYEDMRHHFAAYPRQWGLRCPDPSIDHRRVPNLMTFFRRQGASLPVTQDAAHYLPGDIVCWQLKNGITHIGILSHIWHSSGRLLVVHNIGRGQVAEDCLFEWPIIGHYRWRVNGQ